MTNGRSKRQPMLRVCAQRSRCAEINVYDASATIRRGISKQGASREQRRKLAAKAIDAEQCRADSLDRGQRTKSMDPWGEPC